MRNTLETRLGIFVLLAMLAALMILEFLGGVEFFRPGYRIHALFNTTHELKVGDRVKMAGVEIGRVEKISLDEANSKVKVTMKIHKRVDHTDVLVKTDSKARITFQGFLGQNFVAVDFGSPGAKVLENDQVIGTEEQAD